MGVSKKWILFFLMTVLSVAAFITVKSNINSIKRTGELSLPGLHEPVKVVRDENGMAYIYAQNDDDLFFAQGFITAQDRLFMMELLRIIATGRLTEVMGSQGKTGEKARKSDIRMRTIGFHRNAKKHAKTLGDKDKNRFQKYVDGVNAYLESRQSELPVELTLMGLKPDKWNIADSLAIVYYMGFGSAANLKTEIITQLMVEKLGAKKTKELLPIIINPDDPSGKPIDLGFNDPQTSQVALQTLKDVLPLADENLLAVGSNNWVTSGRLSSSGKPILANDPHLAATILPGPLYPMGLISPNIRAVGVNGAGFPGMIAGRTEHMAIGVTNGYGDTQDLYVETLYSENPDQYLQNGRSFPLKIIKETLKIKDSSTESGYREEEIEIRLTERGPIISGLFDKLKSDKVISFRWAAFERMGESVGYLDILTAKNISEMREILSRLNIIMLNYVLADNNGDIAWQTNGRIPIRSISNGTIPHIVKKGGKDWSDWIPWEDMPHSINPEKGWVGTANHAVVTRDYPYYYSSHFAPTWRYSRIKELMSAPGTKTVDDHWSYQRDTKNPMAERVTPILVKILETKQATKKIAEILSRWNYHDDPDQVAPSIFQILMYKIFLQTYEDELGEDLSSIMLQNTYFWQQRMVIFLEKGGSDWFDDKRTSEYIESMEDIVVRAGIKTVAQLIEKYGANPNNWLWGKLHKINFVSVLRRSGFGSELLGGSYSIPGSAETLYRSMYNYTDSFDTTVHAALRMVVDMGDPDKITAVLPGGASARLLDRHRTDQVKAYMDGTKLYWWFSDQAIEEHTQTELSLLPLKDKAEK